MKSVHLKIIVIIILCVVSYYTTIDTGITLGIAIIAGHIIIYVFNELMDIIPKKWISTYILAKYAKTINKLISLIFILGIISAVSIGLILGFQYNWGICFLYLFLLFGYSILKDPDENAHKLRQQLLKLIEERLDGKITQQQLDFRATKLIRKRSNKTIFIVLDESVDILLSKKGMSSLVFQVYLLLLHDALKDLDYNGISYRRYKPFKLINELLNKEYLSDLENQP